MLRKFLLITALLLIAVGPGWAQGYAGGGFSFDQEASNPGASLSFGAQMKIGTNLLTNWLPGDSYARLTYSSVNWGDELDKASGILIQYFPVDLWIIKRIGGHGTLDYGVETKTVTLGFGGEVYVPILPELAAVLMADNYRTADEADPKQYFEIGLGFVLFP